MSKEKLEEAIRAIKSNWPDERYSMLRDALDYVISEAERAESLQEKLNAKIALINKGDEEFCYTEQGKMIELEQQNKRYRERMAQLINYIEMTDDDVDQQVHKIHVILDRTLEGESNE